MCRIVSPGNFFDNIYIRNMYKNFRYIFDRNFFFLSKKLQYFFSVVISLNLGLKEKKSGVAKNMVCLTAENEK